MAIDQFMYLLPLILLTNLVIYCIYSSTELGSYSLVGG